MKQGLNIEHLDSVDVGDSVVLPFDPLTEYPLTSEHPNDSLPMELMPNELDQAFLLLLAPSGALIAIPTYY